jgi:RNA polymerase sigma-70 factor (ECF subfamily)
MDFGRIPLTTSAMDDERMLLRAIERAKEGDMGALHYLYVRFADDVHRHVRRIVSSPHDAEDVTQNVFAKLMASVLHYEQRQVPFRAWILKVARNAALDYVRSQRLVPCEDVRIDEDSQEQASLDRRVALREALELLPEDQRQVIVMRHLGGFSPTEIAQLLGRTEASIHGLHYRGRSAVQSILRSLEIDPGTRAA